MSINWVGLPSTCWSTAVSPSVSGSCEVTLAASGRKAGTSTNVRFSCSLCTLNVVYDCSTLNHVFKHNVTVWNLGLHTRLHQDFYKNVHDSILPVPTVLLQCMCGRHGLEKHCDWTSCANKACGNWQNQQLQSLSCVLRSLFVEDFSCPRRW